MKPRCNESIERDRWERISSAFADALELAPDARERNLPDLCAGSDSVEREVRRLLSEHREAGAFLERPALFAPQTGGERPEPGRVFEDGEILGARFHVIRLLGAGGMGEVYEALDSTLREHVAVKTLRAAGRRDPAMAERFCSEVLRSRLITHPNVARVHDLFLHTLKDGSAVPFFTMKLLAGETLSEWMARAGPVPPQAALPLLRNMAEALHAAHRVGIVHRDFKPGNVFITQPPGEAPKAIVADFGLAAESAPGAEDAALPAPGAGASALAGTPAYMAPEQMNGEEISRATDVYALGLVAYEMLTGKRAYGMPSPLVCALKKLAPGDPALFGDACGISPRWVNAIHRCVRRNPKERFQDALDFVQELEDPPAVPAPPRRFRLPGKASLAAVVAVLLSAGAFLTERGWRSVPRQPSIAVLPFESDGGDPDTAYFRDGVAEELARSLTAYPKLHVAAQVASLRYRNLAGRLKEVADELGVEMLLMGSVRRTGARLRIAVQLVRGSNRKQVWSQIYDRDIRQIFAVEGEITAEVAARLALGEATHSRERPPTVDMRAHDLYLRGRYLWNTRTREGLLKGLEYFEQAIGLDQNFALAQTAIADTYTVLVDYGWMPPLEAAPKIGAALKRSLALDPDSADTQASLGLFNELIEWDQAGAERAFQKALALNPSLLTAHLWYGGYLMRSARLSEALREAESARRLDPVSLPTLVFLGWVRYYRREYPAAIEIGDQAIELNPSFPHGHQLLALTYAASGRREQALRSIHVAVGLTPDPAVALRYRALALSLMRGFEAESRQIAARLETLSPDRQSGYLAIVYGGLGDRERMYYWADRAIQARDGSLLLANVEPALDRFRPERRFQDVLRKMGFGSPR